MIASDTYRNFLARKHSRPTATGFDVPDEHLNSRLFDWQRLAVRWALKRGRAALFESTGLGKTIQQLAWAEAVVRHTNKPVLILAPLAVASQTVREASRFVVGVPVARCVTQADVPECGIAVTNYHKLDHFDPTAFSGVVLDESSILKSFMGKTKQKLCQSFSQTPYRLACTATPSPNDHLEIGNHSQFLGVMDSDEMISRWFVNDGSEVGTYRLKGHAADDYWSWVASWAVAINKPSDLGYEDGNYNLPELVWHDVHVSEKPIAGNESLFDDSLLTAATLQRSRKATVDERAKAIAALVKKDKDLPWLIWCHTNAEADALKALLPKAAEVRGSESEESKEAKLTAFSDGQGKVLITKPRIAGFGMNWQHCRRIAFTGLTFSFEDVFQAVRRCWRFGQTEPVHVYTATTDADGAIIEALRRKQRQYEEMSTELRKHFANQVSAEDSGGRQLSLPKSERLRFPQWIQTKELSNAS